jgi:hypothetical protein
MVESSSSSSVAPERQQVPGFQEELDNAVLNAVLVPVEEDVNGVIPLISDGSERNHGVDAYRNLPDDEDMFLNSGLLDGPNVVSISDPEEYKILIRLALGLPAYSEGDALLEEHAALAYQHEMEHAAIVAEIVPEVEIRYAVRMFRGELADGKTQYFTQPSIIIIGDMRKIDLAMITAGPTTHSTSDTKTIQDLGYDSAEEIAARYKALGKLS